MKLVSPALKSWVELVEKFLLIISTSIIILTAAYKGGVLITSKSEKTIAEKEETEKRTKVIDLMAETYTKSLTQLNSDIKKIDAKLEEQLGVGSYGWKQYSAIREEKVKDRNALLQLLGNQVVQLKQAEK
ncbi:MULTISPECIES: hypothetical protein [Raoultella]|uniref:hypothetical protein n=1 Tax=Raoultella TaxID=160674 RepID=UPI00064F5129|nr:MULTISPECIES: hypothetical protein [Raoultella]AXC30304.1 hypothetical protein DSD31_12910 [Raoultella sp. X13]EKW1875226.1 hypothetical protein [Raoultella ornithinolytica]VTN58642.1 Uncharacterised protein [Raoultella ornithinolytica]HEC2558645.1 hypothetical protein [Raoultella ornithinolytica]